MNPWTVAAIGLAIFAFGVFLGRFAHWQDGDAPKRPDINGFAQPTAKPSEGEPAGVHPINTTYPDD